jgi:hypothetical protein
MTASPGRRLRTSGRGPGPVPAADAVPAPAPDAPAPDAKAVDEAPTPAAPADAGTRPDPAPPSGPASSGESPLRSALSVLTTLGPPLTIVTALMFYFGWKRSERQASYMGLDVSLFGFSSRDYVLQSITTLFVPLLTVAALALGWLVLHQRVDRALARPSARPALRTAGRAAVGVGLLAAGAAVVTIILYPKSEPLVVPLVLAAGMATAAYGGWLAGAAADPRAAGPAAPPWQRALFALLVGGVITLALFWEVSSFAGVVGRGKALEIARQVPRLPRATAFSATPLGIDAPGVREERLDPDPGAAQDTPRYRTTGLRFLSISGGRLFLVHDGWTPRRGTVIVLPDTDQVRWQFSR